MSITTEEQVVVQVFRSRLSDLDINTNPLLMDMHLIRFLRGRDMNLDKAEDMLRKHLEWRRDNNLDSVLDKQIPESYRSEFPLEIVGHDKNENPLVVIPYGKMDIKKGLREKGKEEAWTMVYYYLEYVYQASLKKSDGKVMKRFSILLDVEGLTYSQFASVEVLDYLFGCLQIFEKNYPESLAIAYVINAPTVWSVLWSMGKVFIHPNTIAKVRFLPKDISQARAILLEDVDESQFPVQYGGTAVMKYPEPVRILDENENKAGGFFGFFRK